MAPAAAAWRNALTAAMMAARGVLGAEVMPYSDGALGNEHVSPDLAATPL